MTKTFALLMDAYRELNAKRLFWVVLFISALVVSIFGIVGVRNESVTILNWESPIRFVYLSLISQATFYKLLFVTLGIQYWLSWLAVILALVSTAGMFPDFLAGGSIELYLSKPISRLRLFATKYLGGLLFVACCKSPSSASAAFWCSVSAAEPGNHRFFWPCRWWC